MFDEGLSQLGGSEELRQELLNLQKKQANAVKPEDWNVKVDGKRLMELQNFFSKSTAQPLSPELGKRQTEAGTVVNGVRQPDLTSKEQRAIVSANRNTSNK